LVDKKLVVVVTTWILHSAVYLCALLLLNMYYFDKSNVTPMPLTMIVLFALIMGGIEGMVVSRR